MKQQQLKIAYLILAHDQPRHLLRLINALNCEGVAFFVHIDRKSNLDSFTSQINFANVLFAQNRERINWGGFSIVEATLRLMQTAYDDPRNFDYFILLSGADYPVKANRTIKDFLISGQKDYISLAPMPVVREYEHKTMERLRKIHIESLFPVNFKPLVVFHNLLKYLLNIALTGLHTRKEFLEQKELIPYAGHQWWALRRETVNYIFSYLAENVDYVKFFKFCKHSDEMFFHTIIGNSHYKENTEPCLTYTDWRGQDHHPAKIISDHIDTICQHGNFKRDEVYGDGKFMFIRKFIEEDEHLMDRIDNELR